MSACVITSDKMGVWGERKGYADLLLLSLDWTRSLRALIRSFVADPEHRQAVAAVESRCEPTEESTTIPWFPSLVAQL